MYSLARAADLNDEQLAQRARRYGIIQLPF
jgi:hypothetical protein